MVPLVLLVSSVFLFVRPAERGASSQLRSILFDDDEVYVSMPTYQSAVDLNAPLAEGSTLVVMWRNYDTHPGM